MRILAATQADDLALEVGNLQHGMLTYTLLNLDLKQGQADFRPKDGAVHLGEWLNYATDGGATESLKGLLQPALFDFRRSRAQELRLQ